MGVADVHVETPRTVVTDTTMVENTLDRFNRIASENERLVKGEPTNGTAGSNKRWHDPNDLKKKIRTQIEYYFSNENLHKDVYFRNQMDDQGWVSLEVIAQFNRVKSLLLYTNDPSVLYDALLTSKSLEVDTKSGRTRRKDTRRKRRVSRRLAVRFQRKHRLGLGVEQPAMNTPPEVSPHP